MPSQGVNKLSQQAGTCCHTADLIVGFSSAGSETIEMAYDGVLDPGDLGLNLPFGIPPPGLHATFSRRYPHRIRSRKLKAFFLIFGMWTILAMFLQPQANGNCA